MILTEASQVQKKKIYILDEDRVSMATLRDELRKNHFEPSQWDNIEKGLQEIRSNPPDLLIFDLHPVEKEAFQIIQDLKASEPLKSIPLMISSSSRDKMVQSLESGGDDFILKPFGIQEILSRIRTLLRRNKLQVRPEKEGKIKIGDLILFLDEKEVHQKGTIIQLTFTETKILKALAEKPGMVLSREQLISSAWLEDQIVEEQNLDVHICSIRKKLKTLPFQTSLIVTHRGFGYKLDTFTL